MKASPPSSPPLKARFDGRYYICECGAEMMSMPTEVGTRSVLICPKMECQHFAATWLEPIIELERSYEIREQTNSTPSITCRLCGLTSHDPHDVEERYCGKCGMFHDGARPKTA